MHSHSIAWLLLGCSVVSEVAGTVALRHSDGFGRPIPAVAAGSCYLLAVWLMSLAMRQLEMGLTYAIWAGSGTALTALAGIILYAEPASSFKLGGLALIVAGVVMLNLAPRAA